MMTLWVAANAVGKKKLTRTFGPTLVKAFHRCHARGRSEIRTPIRSTLRGVVTLS